MYIYASPAHKQAPFIHSLVLSVCRSGTHTHTHTHAHTHTVQLGFWDPRSDDDHLVVTSLDFQEELLAVGLHGGVALIFNLSSQTSVVDMKVCVSFLQFDLPLRY